MGLVQSAIDNEITSADEVVSKMRILRSGIASKMRNIDSLADKLTPDIDRRHYYRTNDVINIDNQKFKETLDIDTRYYYRTNDDIIDIDNQKFKVNRRSYSAPPVEYRRRKRYGKYNPYGALDDTVMYTDYGEISIFIFIIILM